MTGTSGDVLTNDNRNLLREAFTKDSADYKAMLRLIGRPEDSDAQRLRSFQSDRRKPPRPPRPDRRKPPRRKEAPLEEADVELEAEVVVARRETRVGRRCAPVRQFDLLG